VRILRARYRNAGDFLAHHQPAFVFGGLFYPTREAIPLGESVIVEVRFPELTDRMFLRGKWGSCQERESQHPDRGSSCNHDDTVIRVVTIRRGGATNATSC